MRVGRGLYQATVVYGLMLLLTGCTTVGPDFSSPRPPAESQVTPEASVPRTVSAPVALGESQEFSATAHAGEEWWKAYRSTALNQVVAQGLAQNPTVAAAQASLIQAGEYAAAVRDNLTVPTVDAQLGQTRERLSTAAFGLPGGQAYTFSLTNASVNVAYPLDVFGGNRRQIEALEAQHEMQAHLWQAARETLIANIVTTVVREATLRDQRDATDAVIQAQTEILALARQRQSLGALSSNDVQEPAADLALSRATRLSLEQQLDQTRHQLAAYLGQTPAEFPLPEFHLADLHLPQQLPRAVPSELVHRRPDIRASEAQWHQASANLGVTIAGAYPAVNLTGSMGAMALTPGTLFNAASSVWSLGAGVVQPLFHGGALAAEKRGAEAALQAAAAQYRKTVVEAFRSVADVLRALDHDASTLVVEQEAADAHQQSLDLADHQYAVGGVSYLTVLNARVQSGLAHQGVAQAQGGRLADTAAFYLALGGESPSGSSVPESSETGTPSGPLSTRSSDPAVSALR